MVYGIGTGSKNYSYYSGRGANRNVKMPTLPSMRTRGQCKLSEKELLSKIRELARKDAAEGTDSQHAESFQGVRYGSAEWQKLRDDYVSFASPDRVGIIKNTLSGFAGKIQSMTLTGKNSDVGFFDIIFNNCKKFGPDVGGNFVIFRDEQGNEIARYSEPNGWSFRYTPAEDARLDEFNALWKQALTDAQTELKQGV